MRRPPFVYDPPVYGMPYLAVVFHEDGTATGTCHRTAEEALSRVDQLKTALNRAEDQRIPGKRRKVSTR